MITVRPIERTDTQEIYDLLTKTSDAFSTGKVMNYKDLADYIELATDHSKGSILDTKLFGVVLDGALIGEISIDDSELYRGHQLGYWMSSEHRGRGYMKTALQQVMKLLEDDHPFVAHVLEDNAPSLWLLWGLGFKEIERVRYKEGGPIWVQLMYNRHLK